MVTKYATTVNEYRESETASMRKIHAIVIFVSYMKVHLYKKCEPAQVNKLMRQIKSRCDFVTRSGFLLLLILLMAGDSTRWQLQSLPESRPERGF